MTESSQSSTSFSGPSKEKKTVFIRVTYFLYSAAASLSPGEIVGIAIGVIIIVILVFVIVIVIIVVIKKPRGGE